MADRSSVYETPTFRRTKLPPNQLGQRHSMSPENLDKVARQANNGDPLMRPPLIRSVV